MRTAIVIPARIGATRLPRKPLLALGELPVIVRVLRQAGKVPGIDAVVVATDDDAIFDAVRAHGGDAVMTSPSHQSGTDRCAEVARARDYDRVINVQGDEPFVAPRDLAAIAEALIHRHTDMATLIHSIATREDFLNPNVVKVVVRDDGHAMYFSRAPIPFDRRGDNAFAEALRHIGVYGYSRAALERMTGEQVHPLERCEGLEQLRALALGLSIATVRAVGLGRGIDTQDDLDWARAQVARLGDQAFPDMER